MQYKKLPISLAIKYLNTLPKMNALSKIFLTLLFIISISTAQVQAQDELDQFLEAGLEDANTMIGGYVEPFMEAFSVGLGAGWYNTAKAHKSAGFDLTVTVNPVYVPNDKLFYAPTFNNITYDPNGPQRSPTLFGPEGDDVKPTYIYDYEENGQIFTGEFEGLEGIDPKENIGMQALPVPMAQLGIGIIKNTDIKIRWTPTIDVGDNGEFKIIGFAIMHDVKQHIPGIKDLPFDLSALVGFTDMSLEYDLAAESPDLGPNASGEVVTQDGKAVFDVNTWTIQGIISKKFSVLTVYGGLGYNIAKSNLGLKGTYQVIADDGAGFTVEREYTNPIDVSFSASGPRMTAGFRLKLAIFTLHADYTLQKYNTLSVGFGFAVR